MYLFWRSTISDYTGWRHEILRCLYQLYLFLLVGYPGDGYICVKIYRMTSSFICQPLGALRQSLLFQEWESKCLSVVHTAAGNYRRVRIGGYSLINCYPIPSGDDRRSTVTVVHERSDIIYDAPRKGTLRKLHYIVSDACFDRITSHFPRFGNSTRVREQTDKLSAPTPNSHTWFARFLFYREVRDGFGRYTGVQDPHASHELS